MKRNAQGYPFPLNSGYLFSTRTRTFFLFRLKVRVIGSCRDKIFLQSCWSLLVALGAFNFWPWKKHGGQSKWNSWIWYFPVNVRHGHMITSTETLYLPCYQFWLLVEKTSGYKYQVYFQFVKNYFKNRKNKSLKHYWYNNGSIGPK